MEQKKTREKTSPRDFFLHLLSSVTLYMSAIGILTVLFQTVNHFFPDALQNGYYSTRTSFYGPLRFAISMLLVVFPVYMWTVVFLGRTYRKEPEKRDLRIRKWLIYFTLFVSAFIIIGSLISLLNSFLSGGLTTPFVLKVLSVIAVTVAIFSYYILDVRGTTSKSMMRAFGIGSSVAVFIAIITAFFIIGSPKEMRMLRFDEQRVTHLQQMSYWIQDHYSRTGELPESIEEIPSNMRYAPVPRDPETGADYEYKVTGETTYELCATFNRASEQVDQTQPSKALYGVALDFWSHDAGYDCIELEVQKIVEPTR